jgi:anti-anti-sigma factor
MDIEVRTLGTSKLEVRPYGRLVEETVGVLRAELLDNTQGAAAVLLNLSDLDEIDSAGMALVLLARIEHEAMGGRLVVESSDPEIAEVLEAAGMDRFVTVARRRIDALRALGADEHPAPEDDALPTLAGRVAAEPRTPAASAQGGRWLAPIPS